MLQLPLWVKIVAGVAVVVGVSGGVSSCFGKPPTTTKTETRTTTEEKTLAELQETIRRQGQTIEALKASTARTEQRDLNTRTTETITRYVPGPRTSPASPVVMVRSDLPNADIARLEGAIERVERVTETIDRGRTDESSNTEKRTDSSTTEDVNRTEKSATNKKTETVTKTETKTGGTGGDSGDSRLAVGITAQREPAVLYDVFRHNLKLGPVQVAKVGAGVAVTGPPIDKLSDFNAKRDLDFGPQANITPGKSPWGAFAMYKVRKQEATAGILFRF